MRHKYNIQEFTDGHWVLCYSEDMSYEAAVGRYRYLTSMPTFNHKDIRIVQVDKVYAQVQIREGEQGLPVE